MAATTMRRAPATMPSTPTPTTPTTASPDSDESQLALLRLLNEQPQLSQRELSQSLGLSLGKTHYVLHALLDRGLVKVGNFKRNDNKLAYAYLLTPAGLHEKLSMTRRFLARKEAEFERLQNAIVSLRAEVGDTSNASIPLTDGHNRLSDR